jgi:hypothetical protein
MTSFDIVLVSPDLEVQQAFAGVLGLWGLGACPSNAKTGLSRTKNQSLPAQKSLKSAFLGHAPSSDCRFIGSRSRRDRGSAPSLSCFLIG